MTELNQRYLDDMAVAQRLASEWLCEAGKHGLTCVVMAACMIIARGLVIKAKLRGKGLDDALAGVAAFSRSLEASVRNEFK